MAKRKNDIIIETPFYKYLWDFYNKHRSVIKKEYKPLTKKILSNADPKNANSFLRRPQYEAFEIYVFLKEYLDNARLSDLFDSWRHNEGKFTLRETDLEDIAKEYEDTLFEYMIDEKKKSIENDEHAFDASIQQLRNLQQDYSNYIFSLTMGTGKTILMALCIFYDFLLANKYPRDERFCHNALVLAPDTTVLQSLKEIQTFDKTKIFEENNARILDNIIKFHFLEEDGIALSTMDGSDFNLIISTSQKIILKKKHAKETPQQKLFNDHSYEESIKNDPNADLYSLNDDEDLMRNQRYIKLTRLKNLGIFVDEAHHAFGKSLKNDMEDRSKETSLRLTIDNLAAELKSAGTSVVACYNFTGTPYIENHLMPEVVYDYGLKEAIENKYLKNIKVKDYENVKTEEFIENAVDTFLNAYQKKDGTFNRYEGMLPKMAIFATTIEELTKELQPALENVLTKKRISLDSILINVGDDKITKQDDLREFLLLDTINSNKQFILLVGKGKEGWNCRSLFSVALFRKPKSTIFVLQATMRCLRSITEEQLTGYIFLSSENKEILANELKQNFRVTVEEITQKEEDDKTQHRIYIRRKVPVTVIEKIPHFIITEKNPGTYTIFDDEFNFDNYKRTVGTVSLENIDGATIRNELTTNEQRQFTEYSLIAELSIFLTQHEVDKNDETKKITRFSPVQIKELLDKSTDGIEEILTKVNYSNDILYDWVIPKLFSEIYKLEYKEGEPREIVKYIVKEPPFQNTDENGNRFYTMKFDDELFINENTPDYSKYNQFNNRKSFDLSGYGFDSKSEKKFFIRNLDNNSSIKHIWFTGMLTNGQSDFFVRYIDPDSHALRSYYPDFLVEMNDGNFYIVEIKGENLIPKAETQAKVEYAKRMFQIQNKMNYVFIPSNYADMILQEFIEQAANNPSLYAQNELFAKEESNKTKNLYNQNYTGDLLAAEKAPKYKKKEHL